VAGTGAVVLRLSQPSPAPVGSRGLPPQPSHSVCMNQALTRFDKTAKI